MKRWIVSAALLASSLAGCSFVGGDGAVHTSRVPGIDYYLCGVPSGCDSQGRHFEYGQWVHAPPATTEPCLIPEGCER